MEVNQILKSDVLDIIFDGRYKDYGAYELRKTYDKRIRLALIFTITISVLFFIVSLFIHNTKKNYYIVSDEIIIDDFKGVDKKIEPPKPSPPLRTNPSSVEITNFTPPLIVEDDKVKPNDKTPAIDNLEGTIIGTINQPGDKSNGVLEGPIEASTGVAQINTEEDYEKVFPSVQIPSEFPGGDEAWKIYLQRNLNSEVPKNNGAPIGKYTVEVSFIVDKEGNISNVTGVLPNDVNDYGTIEEAVRVIKRGPKWKPGIQNGVQVKSLKKQKITFLIFLSSTII
jgi:periplasmic protein TonB